MKPYKRSLHFTEGVSSATTGETGLYFGARRHNGDQYNGLFDGLIYEVIFYDRDLTAEEFAKVHSYLAIKHGITLDNEGGGEQGDYVSTIGSTVWDADSDPDFHNQVIGIAQEESEGLFQMQSHTFADTSRIYIGDLAPGNAENQASFGNARTYMIMGNNGGAMCGTESSNLEIPDNEDIIERIEREWKVTNTNFSQDLSLDFRLGSCVEINSLDDQQLRLLVDENSDFSNANVYSTGAAVKLSLVDGVVKVEDIHTDLLPMNESRFVTIAISSVLSNELKEDMANFMIYPNPANEFIVVKGKFLNQDVEIYNALGQQVTSIETSTLEDEERVIDISALPKGSYFVKVGTARKTLIK